MVEGNIVGEEKGQKEEMKLCGKIQEREAKAVDGEQTAGGNWAQWENGIYSRNPCMSPSCSL